MTGTLPYDGDSDEQLIERAKEGEQQAFVALFQRHRRVALVIAARIAGADQADDIVQMAYVAGWRASERYSAQRGTPRTWLLTIVRNRAIDNRRRTQTRRRGDGHAVLSLGEQRLQDAHQAPEIHALARDDARHVREALSALPETQRVALELAYFAGLTHQQIADSLALPLGTIKGRLRLGLERLRHHLPEATLH